MFEVGEEIEAIAVSWVNFFQIFQSLRFSVLAVRVNLGICPITNFVVRVGEPVFGVGCMLWNKILIYISTPSLAPLL